MSFCGFTQSFDLFASLCFFFDIFLSSDWGIAFKYCIPLNLAVVRIVCKVLHMIYNTVTLYRILVQQKSHCCFTQHIESFERLPLSITASLINWIMFLFPGHADYFPSTPWKSQSANVTTALGKNLLRFCPWLCFCSHWCLDNTLLCIYLLSIRAELGSGW